MRRAWVALVPLLLSACDYNTVSSRYDTLAEARADRLFGQLKSGAPRQSRFADWQATRNQYARRGMTAWSWQKNRHTWTFFCSRKEGRCDFFLW